MIYYLIPLNLADVQRKANKILNYPFKRLDYNIMHYRKLNYQSGDIHYRVKRNFYNYILSIKSYSKSKPPNLK